MKLTPVSLLALSTVLFIFTYQDTQVSADVIINPNGGPPIPFRGKEEDEDLGILLTLLILAAKNRCNNRCNCCPPRAVPVPYPVPCPVNDLDISEIDDEDIEDVIDEADDTGNVNSNEVVRNNVADDIKITKVVAESDSNAERHKDADEEPGQDKQRSQ